MGEIIKGITIEQVGKALFVLFSRQALLDLKEGMIDRISLLSGDKETEVFLMRDTKFNEYKKKFINALKKEGGNGSK